MLASASCGVLPSWMPVTERGRLRYKKVAGKRNASSSFPSPHSLSSKSVVHSERTPLSLSYLAPSTNPHLAASRCLRLTTHPQRARYPSMYLARRRKALMSVDMRGALLPTANCRHRLQNVQRVSLHQARDYTPQHPVHMVAATTTRPMAPRVSICWTT